jgi:predicted GIY-YIG superfamily endonuclease
LLRSLHADHPQLLYIGRTIDLEKRVHQHNSRSGGCRKTHGKGPWIVAAYVNGAFKDAMEANDVRALH